MVRGARHVYCVMVGKELTDSLDLTFIAKEFVSLHDERKKYFGSFL